MTATTAGARTGATDFTAIVLGATGATQLVPGILALVAPGAFYDLVAPYPPRNDHVLRDVGSWQIALGLAALMAIRRPSWRVPMLGLLALQFALHAVSHVIDVGRSEPSLVGPVQLALLVAGVGVLGGLFVKERRA